MVLTAIIRKEDDWFVAECPEVGTASQGKSVEEALANLKEATEVYLDEFPQQPGVHPLLTTFEVPAHA
jgi:predicted RNase H-like HicB family nuclease